MSSDKESEEANHHKVNAHPYYREPLIPTERLLPFDEEREKESLNSDLAADEHFTAVAKSALRA